MVDSLETPEPRDAVMLGGFEQCIPSSCARAHTVKADVVHTGVA